MKAKQWILKNEQVSSYAQIVLGCMAAAAVVAAVGVAGKATLCHCK